MKRAVCVIVERGGLYLAVSRRDQFDQLGLPGGKVDENESCEDAAVRELHEETGISCDRDDLIPVYAGVDGTYWATTYLMNTYGFPVEDQEIRVENDQFAITWAPQHSLCHPLTSPFSQYNTAVFSALASYQSSRR